MSARTLEDALQEAAARLDDAGVAFGHGTSDAAQEALWLAAHAMGVGWDDLAPLIDRPIDPRHEAALRDLVARRIATRKPAAYLLNEAWLGRNRFYVDERVIVPRSFIAEWLRPGSPAPMFSPAPATVLDLCTGSGCLAILAALAFPAARVDAVDLSPDALEVARRNVEDYGLQGRVDLVHSDMFEALSGRRYDLVISNPPYVKASAMKALPQEYLREPQMALASGGDGLDHTRVILAGARRHLNPGGRLVVEIGHNRKALEKAFPELPFEWPKTSAGRELVFTLPAGALP